MCQSHRQTMRLTLSGLVDSSPWLDVVNDSDGVCDWFTLSDMLSGADSTDVDDCCWRDAAWFSDLRFSQMFSFGGGAGTSLTGAGFSADGFFVTFLTDSTSWSPSSSTSFETDLDPSDNHHTQTHKHTQQLTDQPDPDLSINHGTICLHHSNCQICCRYLTGVTHFSQSHLLNHQLCDCLQWFWHHTEMVKFTFIVTDTDIQTYMHKTKKLHYTQTTARYSTHTDIAYSTASITLHT